MTTLDRIKAHLTAGAYHPGSTFCRKDFETANGITVSIQQSATHYCSLKDYADFNYSRTLAPDVSENATVEMWCCPASDILEPYGDGDDPYAYVPLTVVAAYIDQLEGSTPCL